MTRERCDGSDPRNHGELFLAYTDDFCFLVVQCQHRGRVLIGSLARCSEAKFMVALGGMLLDVPSSAISCR